MIRSLVFNTLYLFRQLLECWSGKNNSYSLKVYLAYKSLLRCDITLVEVVVAVADGQKTYTLALLNLEVLLLKSLNQLVNMPRGIYRQAEINSRVVDKVCLDICGT